VWPREQSDFGGNPGLDMDLDTGYDPDPGIFLKDSLFTVALL